jgi:hypothetical protein
MACRFQVPLFLTLGALIAVGGKPCFAQWDESDTSSVDMLDADAATPTPEMSTGNTANEAAPKFSSNPSGSDRQNSSQLTEGQKTILLGQVGSGQSLYQFGRVLAWGGLGANVIGSIAKVPALSGIGNLSMVVGIPMMGAGAGKAERSSLKLNPNATPANSTGWPMYWTGWGLQGAGILLIVTGITSNIEKDEYGDETLSDDAAGPIILGFVSIIGGAICHFVAWYQFSERLDQSTVNMAGIALAPTLHMNDGKIDGGGLSLALDF